MRKIEKYKQIIWAVNLRFTSEEFYLFTVSYLTEASLLAIIFANFAEPNACEYN